MSCTERCRKAMPGACCCECGGAHHGEAGPQKRLGLVPGEPRDYVCDSCGAADVNPLEICERTTGERRILECGACFNRAMDLRRMADAIHEAGQVEVHDEACDCAACLSGPEAVLSAIAEEYLDRMDDATLQRTVERLTNIGSTKRQPFDMDIGGRVVHLSPGNRWTPDSVELIWIAQYQGKRASHVDPEAAARKVIA